MASFYGQTMSYLYLFDKFSGTKPKEHNLRLRDHFAAWNSVYIYAGQELDDISDQQVVRGGQLTYHALKSQWESENLCNNLGRIFSLSMLEPHDRFSPSKSVYPMLSSFRMALAHIFAGSHYIDSKMSLKALGHPPSVRQFDEYNESRNGPMALIPLTAMHALELNHPELHDQMHNQCVAPFMGALLGAQDDLIDLDTEEMKSGISKFPVAYGYDSMNREKKKEFLKFFGQQDEYSAQKCLEMLLEQNVKTDLYERYVDEKLTKFWENWQKIECEEAKYALVLMHDFFFDLYVKQDVKSWHGSAESKM